MNTNRFKLKQIPHWNGPRLSDEQCTKMVHTIFAKFNILQVTWN